MPPGAGAMPSRLARRGAPGAGRARRLLAGLPARQPGGAGGRPELGLGSANGWFARGQRVLESVAGDCVERGYLLVPCVEKQLAAGDFDGAFATAAGEARSEGASRTPTSSPARCTSRVGS